MTRPGFPGGASGKEFACQRGRQKRSLGEQDPLEEEMAPTPVFLPGNPMDRGAWWATAHGVAKNQTRPSPMTRPQLPSYSVVKS